MTKATIRSNGCGRYYISLGQTRLRGDYKMPATAARIARSKGYDEVTIDPGADPTLVSVARLCKYSSCYSGRSHVLTVQVDKYGAQAQEITFRQEGDLHQLLKFANEWLVKMGFKPVRLTRNILNPDSGDIVIDADTPSYMDPGSEAYHSM